MNWYYIATVCYGLADLLFVEIGLSMFFKRERKGHVKFLLDFGLSREKRMSLYAWSFVAYGLVFFVFSNLVQEPVVAKFMVLGWKLIFLFFALLAFDIYWIAKTISSKKKPSKLVETSGFIFIVSVLLLLVSYVLEWYAAGGLI